MHRPHEIIKLCQDCRDKIVVNPGNVVPSHLRPIASSRRNLLDYEKCLGIGKAGLELPSKPGAGAKHIAAVGALVLFFLMPPARGADKVLAAAPAITARTVAYHANDIVPIAAELHYTTLIELPPNEKILVAACGDKDDWGVESSMNLLFLTPGKRDAATNINIVAASGNVYSFAVREISGVRGASADLKVLVKSSDASFIEAAKGKPLFVSADTVEGYKIELASAERALAEQKEREARQIKLVTQTAQTAAQSEIRHDFSWDRDSKAARLFDVRAIYQLGGKTIIEASPQELPSVYELKDGKPALLQYRYDAVSGRYIIPRIVDAGFLRLGKHELKFRREG